jgi:Fe-S-cluster containining protein
LPATSEWVRDEFIAAYLERDEEPERYHIKTTPCPFLGDDSRCTIYAVRPEKCQGYPFTDKPGFAASTMNHANNAVVCPAVFYLVQQMKRRFGQ